MGFACAGCRELRERLVRERNVLDDALAVSAEIECQLEESRRLYNEEDKRSERRRHERDRLAGAAQEMIAAWELWDRGRMDEAITHLRAALSTSPAKTAPTEGHLATDDAPEPEDDNADPK